MSNLNFSPEIRFSPRSKFVKDLSQRFTVMPISRRHNEHKTRPCSLVLMRRPVPAIYVVLRPSFPQRRSSFLFVLLCLHQRRHAEVLYFPWAVQSEWKPSRAGKATHNTQLLFLQYVYMCGHKVTSDSRDRFRVNRTPRKIITRFRFIQKFSDQLFVSIIIISFFMKNIFYKIFIYTH